MVYTLRDLFDDCATRNKRVGATKPFDSESYRLVWDAVTAWVESQLASKRGASLHGFATITYRKMARSIMPMPSSFSLQPVFLLHENFSRSSMMATRRSAPTIKELTINEEMNFSKLALMYVKQALKKDTIASCWKNMVARIGEVMKAGVEMKLDFGVGVMIAKDNKVDFNFSAQFGKAITMHDNSSSSTKENSSNTTMQSLQMRTLSMNDSNDSFAESSSGAMRNGGSNNNINGRRDPFSNSDNQATTTSGRKLQSRELQTSSNNANMIDNNGMKVGDSVAHSEEDNEYMMTIKKKKLTARACALSDAETRQKVR